MEHVSTELRLSGQERPETKLSDYFILLKPKVMTLVVFSGVAGMVSAPGFSGLHPFLAFIAMACLAVNAGAAGAINMWYERDLDALMRRTSQRPLPQGRLLPDEALVFAVMLSLASVLMMGIALNWVAAGLLAAANLFYVFIYTIWLKRRTPQNIVIGGAAGAFPPAIGWAAVTGHLGMEPLILFALIFFWTPPHFWALALFASGDYKKAGVPMLPVVAGERATKRQMLAYTILLLPLAVLPWVAGYASALYGAIAAGLGSLFVLAAIRVLHEPEGQYRAAKRMFGYSVFYLFALFLAYMFNQV